MDGNPTAAVTISLQRRPVRRTVPSASIAVAVRHSRARAAAAFAPRALDDDRVLCEARVLGVRVVVVVLCSARPSTTAAAVHQRTYGACQQRVNAPMRAAASCTREKGTMVLCVARRCAGKSGDGQRAAARLRAEPSPTSETLSLSAHPNTIYKDVRTRWQIPVLWTTSPPPRRNPCGGGGGAVANDGSARSRRRRH